MKVGASIKLMCLEATYENYTGDSLVYSYLLPIHPTACRDAAPWRQHFIVPEGAQHSSASSWEAFWRRIHVSISRCPVQVENIMLSLISSKVTRRFASLWSRKAVLGSLCHRQRASDLAEENSRGICLVPLKWNMNRSSIWSSSSLCK